MNLQLSISPLDRYVQCHAIPLKPISGEGVYSSTEHINVISPLHDLSELSSAHTVRSWKLLEYSLNELSAHVVHQLRAVAHKAGVRVLDGEVVHPLRALDQPQRLYLAPGAVGPPDVLALLQVPCGRSGLLTGVEQVLGDGH